MAAVKTMAMIAIATSSAAIAYPACVFWLRAAKLALDLGAKFMRLL